MARERYFIVVENTLEVFEVDGKYESITDVYKAVDIEHYSHGESCIVICEYHLGRLAANIRDAIRP